MVKQCSNRVCYVLTGTVAHFIQQELEWSNNLSQIKGKAAGVKSVPMNERLRWVCHLCTSTAKSLKNPMPGSPLSPGPRSSLLRSPAENSQVKIRSRHKQPFWKGSNPTVISDAGYMLANVSRMVYCRGRF